MHVWARDGRSLRAAGIGGLDELRLCDQRIVYDRPPGPGLQRPNDYAVLVPRYYFGSLCGSCRDYAVSPMQERMNT
jgi:hypothetical protein